MTPEDINRYGLVGVALLWAVREVWPFVAKQYSGERGAAVRQAEEERLWKHRTEERHTDALETISKILVEMNARLSNIESDTRDARNDLTILTERRNITRPNPSPKP